MKTISAEKYVEGVESIYTEKPGYEEGHDGSDGLCDCIGMCRGGLLRGGATDVSNMRGTNQAARKTIRDLRELTSEAQLQLGDVVLKTRDKDDQNMPLPDRYRKGGADYDSRWGETNFTHIGTVTGINPIEITHMTSPTAKKDNSLKGWFFYGKLPWVDQEAPGPGPGPEPEPPEPVPHEYATVWSQNGKPVNTRKGPGTNYAMSLAGKVPVGDTVEILGSETNGKGEEWCRIRWTDPRGATWVCWMKAEFLIVAEPVPPEGMYTVIIPGLTKEQAEGLCREWSGAIIEAG